MKTILFTFLSISISKANELSSLLRNNAQAADAVDAGLQVLKDLKNANIQAQKEDDALNKTREAEQSKIVGDFLNIAEQNKKAGDDATAHVKYISSEIAKGIEYGKWIIQRRDELNKKRKNLSEQRCVSNSLFIKSLKQHKEALEVIRLLKEDVAGVIEEHTNPKEALVQIKDSFSKLAAYSELFKAEQIAEFNQLTINDAQDVNEEYLHGDQRSVDNNRDAYVSRQAEHNHQQRNTPQRFIDMINKLEQHMIDSMRNLEDNEIQAALDLATWLSHSEADLIFLNKEEEANKVRQDKLAIEIVGAKSHEEAAWARYFEASAAYHSAVEAREAIRTAYLAEKARREEENRILDDVIAMYVKQVSVLDDSLRGLATDYHNDSTFDTDIKRSVDDIYAKDSGKLHQNVVAEQQAL